MIKKITPLQSAAVPATWFNCRGSRCSLPPLTSLLESESLIPTRLASPSLSYPSSPGPPTPAKDPVSEWMSVTLWGLKENLDTAV